MIETRIRTVSRVHKFARSLRFNADMYLTPPEKSMNDLLDEHRLAQRLRSAVKRDHAPQSLLDSIRRRIRA